MMNKYQKALNCVISTVGLDNGCAGIFFKYNGEMFESIDVLKELVEKATPKEMMIDNNRPYLPLNVRVCPVCNAYVTIKDNYCHKCGQRLE